MNAPSFAIWLKVALLVGVVAAISICVQGETSAQTAPLSEVKLEKGELQLVAPFVRHLISLRMEGKHLRMARDWTDPFADSTEDNELLKVFVDNWVRFGESEEEAIEKAENQLVHLKRYRDRKRRSSRLREASGIPSRSKPWMDGLDDVVNAIMTSSTDVEGSTGGNRGNGEFEKRSHSKALLMTTQVTDNYALFVLQETEKPFRALRVHQDAQDGLEIRFTRFDVLVDFAQKSDGQCRLLVSEQKGAHAIFANNFEAMAKDHPGVTHKFLFGLWKDVGIRLPELEPTQDAIETKWNKAAKEWNTKLAVSDESILHKVRNEVGDALGLHVIDSRIVLDREWKKFGGRMTKDELIDDMKVRYRQFNMSDQEIDNLFASATDDQLPPVYSPALREALEGILNAASGASPRRGSLGQSTGGSAGNKVFWRFDNPMLVARAALNKERLNICLSENDKPNRQLVFADANDGSLFATVSDGQFILDLRQFVDGQVRVVFATHDSFNEISANQFGSLSESDKSTYAKSVKPLLKHYGLLPQETDPSQNE